MRCAPFDLKDYFFGELSADERRTMETHLTGCSACREELDALGLTRSALMTVREEEPPRRIAFVSDKVFEPTWYQKLFSVSKLGFASAAMLSAAIVFHGLRSEANFASKPPVTASVQTVDQAKIEAEVSRRVEAILKQAVAESEARQSAKIQQVADQQKRMDFNHKADLVSIDQNFEIIKKRFGMYLRASNDLGAGQ